MDQITKHKLDQASLKLIESIDPRKVCELASSFHPSNRECRIFSDWKKGSFNVCFPVIFDQDDGATEKWVVRIPLLPRLAFPEEKMRSEIATMKYIAEKTSIPIPRLYGYSVGSDNTLGLPFMLLEYIDGKTLFNINLRDLNRTKRDHVYSQLSEIYIQLYQQKFDRIGALSLDENDDRWVFEINSRAMTVDVNEQEICGLDICRYLPPNQTFTSTVDYIFFITKLIYNDFLRGRDSIVDEADARWYLYSIFASQSVLMEWINPEYNHGPFVLMHGDLRPPNIVVDDDLNIVSVLDWEWSHTVPVQLFVPPFWLTNQMVLQISKDIPSLQYEAAAQDLCLSVHDMECRLYRKPSNELAWALSNLWRRYDIEDLLIAHGLLKPHYFGNIYCDALDQRYYGGNAQERMEAFFKLENRQDQLHIIERKVQEFEVFEKERQKLGLERRVTLEYPTRTPEEEADLLEKFKTFNHSRHKTEGSKLQSK